MQRISVNSSSILEVGYDGPTNTLEIMFADGKVYQYFDVPSHVNEELVGAASVGKYFHSNIRGVYRYARV